MDDLIRTFWKGSAVQDYHLGCPKRFDHCYSRHFALSVEKMTIGSASGFDEMSPRVLSQDFLAGK